MTIEKSWNVWSLWCAHHACSQYSTYWKSALERFRAGEILTYVPDARIMTFVQKPDQFIIGIGAPEYPERLYRLRHPPLALYMRGNRTLLKSKHIGIVGTRRATPLGCERTRVWSKFFSEQGWCVTSGLAMGIDQMAHEGSLPNTVAILAFGHDHHYPKENKWLREDIECNGGLTLSAHAPWVICRKHSFLERNHIIAALSQKLVLVEAPCRSGAIHTAHCALEYHGNVFAVPGNPEQLHYAGNIRLIQEGAWPLFHPSECVE